MTCAGVVDDVAAAIDGVGQNDRRTPMVMV